MKSKSAAGSGRGLIYGFCFHLGLCSYSVTFQRRTAVMAVRATSNNCGQFWILIPTKFL